MNKTMKKSLTTLVLSAALLTSAAYPAWASEPAASEAPIAAQAVASYPLSGSIEVELKSLLNEHESDSTKLGAVIRLKNTGSKLTRVPDFELRVRTADGVEYTLEPSSKNPKAVKGKSEQELSYLSTVDRIDDVTLTDISWVDVDLEVYPKKETTLLTLPLDPSMVWNGVDSTITNQGAILKWGEPFTLPSLHSSIVFRPIDIHKEITAKGVSTVVQIQAENPTDERQNVPNFAIDGKTESSVYSGSRAESSVTLEAGEKKYVHVVIPTDLDTEFTSLNVVTPEKFATAAGEESYRVGRINILLPAGAATQGVIPAPSYTLGTPVRLDSTNKFIPSNVEISLEELHISGNDDDAFNTAVAKFKVTNNSDRPLPIPNIQTELISKDGYSYIGTRQANTASAVVPKASYIVSYAFSLPASETGEGLKMNLYSTQTTADTTYKSLLATAKVPVQKEESDDSVLKMYPYNVNIRDWSITALFQPTSFLYNYKLKLDLDIEQDKAVTVDANTSKLQFDLYDNDGNRVGSTTEALAGTNRLYNGTNTISLNVNSGQLDFPLTVKIYEVFTTAAGDTAKRFLTEFKQ
ncbi:hypothetical protein [Paenibacillus hexagrammi]|uniref:Uncharacterized protein n=1 Tax=Paenibacillus hexagrammi TaxID=2908839 RepID=A0ABY3SN85_9BACL|nr:hypothetical protein [Paenibacillus sp. YPD9-1]UJF35179.1 hypothetical protein L0M14_08650 [Paenibacillus sp. YPD9-1]